MSNPPRRRGPRVMHGASKLFAQARDLAGAMARQGTQAAPQQPASEAEAQAALGTLVARLQLAERRVDAVQKTVAKFHKQASKLPEGDPVRTLFEQMLGTITKITEAEL